MTRKGFDHYMGEDRADDDTNSGSPSARVIVFLRKERRVRVWDGVGVDGNKLSLYRSIARGRTPAHFHRPHNFWRAAHVDGGWVFFFFANLEDGYLNEYQTR